jgi:hypothetical protein
MQRAVAKETSRGIKIAKEKTAHKIDIVVAIAMAALGAIEQPRRKKIDWLTGKCVDAPDLAESTAARFAALRGGRIA